MPGDQPDVTEYGTGKDTVISSCKPLKTRWNLNVVPGGRAGRVAWRAPPRAELRGGGWVREARARLAQQVPRVAGGARVRASFFLRLAATAAPPPARSLPLAAAAAAAAASSLSLGLSLPARNPPGRPAGAARPPPASAARPVGVRPGASGARGRRAGQNTETESTEWPVQHDRLRSQVLIGGSCPGWSPKYSFKRKCCWGYLSGLCCLSPLTPRESCGFSSGPLSDSEAAAAHSWASSQPCCPFRYPVFV
ncbi:atherin-like [Onychomys torridus]|uniref:atherin-like n=1 Tax=Onychomys torridus TaxID=38674 RepID=UPI00167FDC36|nr:atherin-like [Onychomys torridus]